MNKIKIVIPLLIVLVISAIIFYTFYRDTHILGGLYIKYDKEQIREKAQQLAENLNAPVKKLKINASLKSNNPLLRQVQQEYGFKKANELLRTYLPGYYWEVNWSSTERSSFTFSNGRDEKVENSSKKVLMDFDNSGNILRYETEINDSTKLPSLTAAQAREKVEYFISKFGKLNNINPKENSEDTSGTSGRSFLSNSNELFNLKIQRMIDLPHRVDYNFIWTGKSSYINDEIKMEATVSGNIISDFKVTYEVPDKYSADNSSIYQSSIDILFYFVIVVLIALLAYRKIRAYEIGFRTAFIFTVLVMISSGLYIYTDVKNEAGWGLLLPLIFGPLFNGGAMFITWAVSETVSREIWKEKIISIDLLTKGYLTHSRVGKSLINGITFGLGLSAVWIILLFIVQSFTGIWSVSYDTLLLSHLNSSSPALNILDKYVYTSLFIFAVFFNLILSGLKSRFKSVPLLLLVSGIIWGLSNSNDIHPIYIGFVLEIILGILFMWSYVKYDGLTTLMALISYFTISKGMSLFTLGHPVYMQAGYFLFVVLIIVIIYALYSVFSKDKPVDLNAITPAFALNITERQHLQRELEIARDVQMSFLPAKNPEVEGLDIASRCIPAFEVGGDYYDFINYEKNKFGIIIGDVSGKGTQAAFYMTLTKGFLKGLSKSFTSPVNFLKEMNVLFYENVDRGTFMSMVSGIFDLVNRKFVLARAGHNPVIVRNSQTTSVETLNPRGLALGLEKGDVFNNAIEEMEISISTGDVLIFYTDGFTEAMNKSSEEFGEERLINIVNEKSDLSSEELLDYIIKEVKIFMAKAPQHDDMTMVIVKIKA